jgi:hypothetical protein
MGKLTGRKSQIFFFFFRKEPSRRSLSRVSSVWGSSVAPRCACWCITSAPFLPGSHASVPGIAAHHIRARAHVLLLQVLSRLCPSPRPWEGRTGREARSGKARRTGPGKSWVDGGERESGGRERGYGQCLDEAGKAKQFLSTPKRMEDELCVYGSQLALSPSRRTRAGARE